MYFLPLSWCYDNICMYAKYTLDIVAEVLNFGREQHRSLETITIRYLGMYLLMDHPLYLYTKIPKHFPFSKYFC